MLGNWLQDLESLEAISQDDDTRQIFLKMAAMSRTGGLPSFLSQLEGDEEIDSDTKNTLSAIARDHTFLLALEDYLQRTQRLH
jgi:hypothetical protein